MSSESFHEQRFRGNVETALVKVKQILEANRSLSTPENVPHTYTDKYLLANVLTSTAIASHLDCLSALGLQAADLLKLKEWSKSRSITIQFSAEEHCDFLREVKRDVESDTKVVTEVSVLGKAADVFKTRVVTTITEYFWAFTSNISLSAYRGVGDEEKGDRIVIFSRSSGRQEIKTSTKTAPYPEVVLRPPKEVNITWLLNNLVIESGGSDVSSDFQINRDASSCSTPRRNAEVDAAVAFFFEFSQWGNLVSSYINSALFNVAAKENKYKLDVALLNADNLFVPVVPLFEVQTEGDHRGRN